LESALEKKLRIAVRKFPPFESAIVKQWQDFETSRRSGFVLKPIALDLIPLTEALFEQNGLKDGTWDIALLNTDWIAAARRRKELTDLSPFIRLNPPEDYPHGLDGFHAAPSAERWCGRRTPLP
jgi:multiple sugar transport system substrate-binding protein